MNKKILLVSGLIVLLGGFFVYEKFGANANQQNPTPIINNSPTQVSGNNNPPAQTSTTTPPPASTPSGQTTGLKDGTYTGSTVSSIYGTTQAQIVITSGQITDVIYLKYPQDRRASLQKSQMSMSVIKQEVIQAQSANVNTVSGATQTSSAFIQSIASALSQA